MLKGLLFTLVTAAVAVGAGYARQGDVKTPETKVVIPVAKTRAVDGKQMYVSYCAPCHGTDGRGGGPVAPELKQPPTDLTLLSRNNGGKFPTSHVVAVIDYGVKVPSHGTAQMPVWGPILGKMDQGSLQEKAMRISNLTRHIEGMQAK